VGWRFHKRICIAKDVYWNIGKRGSSLSVGGHGATVNLSKKGVRSTYSIPGTGISYRSGPSHGSGNRSSTGGVGCLGFLGLLALGFILAPFNKTQTSTNQAATSVESSPSPTSELTQTETTVATPTPNASSSPEVRRAIPVGASPIIEIPNPTDEEATAAFNDLQDQFRRPHVNRVYYTASTDSYNWIGPKYHKKMSMKRPQFHVEVWQPYWRKTHQQ
jgi:Protein of unknown function (DUF4236)